MRAIGTMRWLAVGAMAGMLALGCTKAEETTGPAAATDVQGNDGTGGGTGNDVVAPTDKGGPGIDTPKPPDTGTQTDTAKTDTGTPPAPDGKLGSPCAKDEECAGFVANAEPGKQMAFCFGGFCTARCNSGGTAIPGACSNVSAADIFSTTNWGCPKDYVICMPNAEETKNIACELDADCVALGYTTATCGIGVPSGKHLVGMCLPKNDRKAGGAACKAELDCQSLICLGSSATADGICAGFCKKNADCASGNLCEGVGFLTDSTTQIPGAWGGFCIPNQGSLTYCTKQATCPKGEVCSTSIEPSSLDAQFFCITGVSGGKDVGAPCTKGGDCYSGICQPTEIKDNTIAKGFCTQNCQKDPADCGADMRCGQLLLHENGTADKVTDDVLTGYCVFGKKGDPCVTDVEWCGNEMSCVLANDKDLFGTCAETPGCTIDGECDDKIACTVDKCNQGKCDHSGIADATCYIGSTCYKDGDPDPKNACASCDAAKTKAAWSSKIDGATCDDADACTEKDGCKSGKCEGQAKDCNDKNTCTEDKCKAGACEYAPINETLVCDDGSKCTDGEVCTKGQCLGAAKSCDDKNACTLDACDPATGTCKNDATNEGGDCNDGLFCTTGETCQGGTCKGGGATCKNDAAFPCKEATCSEDPAACGTKNINEGGACSDADACTKDDKCTAGTCAGTGKSCNDNNPCTVDGCDAQGNCTNVAGNEGASCNDEKACTENDKCLAGTCKGTDKVCADTNTCTADSCDATSGQCKHDPTNEAQACTDGDLCTENDLCTGGSCLGAKKSCSDGKDCTDDVCTGGNCTNPNKTPGTQCSDGNACTSGETCAGNSCQGGVSKACSDNKECTDDVCNPSDGVCSNPTSLNDTPCNDGDLCTAGDVCTGGVCTATVATKSCDDSSTCTNDSCDTATGLCKNVSNGTCKTYAADAQPIFSKYCGGCHTGGGSGSHNIGTTYADTQKNSYNCSGKTKGACALDRINDGSMPTFANCSNTFTGSCPSQAERDTLKAWIDQGQKP